MKTLYLLIVPWLMASCSLVGDAVDISQRRSQMVAKGTKLSGEGFTVKVPEDGLYQKADFPTPGGITFRPTEPFFDGLVYFVTPFPAVIDDTHQALEAWNQIPRSKVAQVNVLEKRRTTYQGLKATEAIVDVPQQAGGQIAAVLVVKRDRDILILNRGDQYYALNKRKGAALYCKEGLAKLKRSTVIHPK